MRILYHHRVASKDGQFVHIDELVAALRRSGAEVEIVAPSSAARESFGFDPGGIGRMKRLLPGFVYETAEIAYNLVPFLRLFRAARRSGSDLIYERYNLHLLAGLWAKRIAGVPMMLEVNAPLARERFEHGRLALAGLARATEQAVWRGADAVLPVTGVLAREVRAAGVAEERIFVVPNGVGAAFLADRRAGAAAVRRRLGLDGAVVLGFAGFLRAWHGLDQAVDLLPAAPKNVRLLVVGDGPAAPDLARRAAALGVADRVHFAGLISRVAIPDYVAAFDVALQPRAVPYACPLKLFEYMAAGRPIVAPDQANVREILSAEAALLFAPEDKDGFARAILRLARDPELRARLGWAARREIERRELTWDSSAARVRDIAERLVAARRGKPAQPAAELGEA